MLVLNAANVTAKFNFNKSCIWIIQFLQEDQHIENLTLTRVVFEW